MHWEIIGKTLSDMTIPDPRHGWVCAETLCVTLNYPLPNLKHFQTSHLCFLLHQFNARYSFRIGLLRVTAAETLKPAGMKWREAHAVRQNGGGAFPLRRSVASALMSEMWNCHFDFPSKLTGAARRSPSNGALGVGLKEISAPQPVVAQRRRAARKYLRIQRRQ